MPKRGHPDFQGRITVDVIEMLGNKDLLMLHMVHIHTSTWIGEGVPTSYSLRMSQKMIEVNSALCLN